MKVLALLALLAEAEAVQTVHLLERPYGGPSIELGLGTSTDKDDLKPLGRVEAGWTLPVCSWLEVSGHAGYDTRYGLTVVPGAEALLGLGDGLALGALAALPLGLGRTVSMHVRAALAVHLGPVAAGFGLEVDPFGRPPMVGWCLLRFTV